MKRGTVIFLAGTAALSGIAALFACVSEHARPLVEGGTTNNSIDCDSGGPGNFPNPACDPSDNSCPSGPGSTCPTCGQCPIDKVKCGDPATCLPMADNSKKAVYDFRFRRLWITDPAPLATGVLEGTTGIVTEGVDLAAPTCGDISGKGAFNWLLRIDPTGKTALTGGAPPSPDPFGLGYCFYNHQLGNLPVVPSMVPVTFDDAGAFTTSSISLLNVPIFLATDAGASDPKNVIILPLRSAVLKSATISNNNNCIGSFNSLALDNTCIVNDPSSCSKWHTAGSLGAVMTLEDADKVPLTVLPETLCVLLTVTQPDPDSGVHGCMRDGTGKIIPKGNYCSTTGQPGGCQDSFWLSATFAAAAVTINDGSSEPTCQGSTDGGSDATATDAADAD
jgi:hypothetical protein